MNTGNLGHNSDVFRKIGILIFSNHKKKNLLKLTGDNFKFNDVIFFKTFKGGEERFNVYKRSDKTVPSRSS